MRLQCSKHFIENASSYLEAYSAILKAERSDKNYVGLPKYTTRREIGKQLGWPLQYDDRSMLTFLLNPGEFTKPLVMEQPDQKWHLNINRLPSKDRSRSDAFVSNIINNIERIFINKGKQFIGLLSFSSINGQVYPLTEPITEEYIPYKIVEH